MHIERRTQSAQENIEASEFALQIETVICSNPFSVGLTVQRAETQTKSHETVLKNLTP